MAENLTVEEILERADQLANGSTAIYDWQREFELKADLLQEDIYRFEEHLAKSGGVLVQRANMTAEHELRAAIEAGWVVSPECEAGDFDHPSNPRRKLRRHYYGGVLVEKLHPGKVRWLGNRVIERYNDAVAVPKV